MLDTSNSWDIAAQKITGHLRETLRNNPQNQAELHSYIGFAIDEIMTRWLEGFQNPFAGETLRNLEYSDNIALLCEHEGR
ncbi:hypothetical protein CSKR_203294, partial [Clonorchis sinensis]